MDNSLFSFVKTQCTAAIATTVDFTITLILLECFDCYYMFATALGTITAGIINCLFNYKWSFKGNEIRFYYVFPRFLLVWISGIVLNIYGVYLLKNGMQATWEYMAMNASLCVMVAKLISGNVVSICWNYTGYRFFVYKNLHLKQKIGRKKIKRKLKKKREYHR